MAKQLLHGYKFERARSACIPIAQHLAAILPYMSRNTVVTCVPTDTRRMRARGYDHAGLVARELARELRLPYQRLVTRVTHTRQVGASRAMRLKQLQGAFLVVGSVPQNVLVVDDVVTTGATLEAVAAVLRTAGARHVDAAVFTQKM